jgi:hypothetical protein
LILERKIRSQTNVPKRKIPNERFQINAPKGNIQTKYPKRGEFVPQFKISSERFIANDPKRIQNAQCRAKFLIQRFHTAKACRSQSKTINGEIPNECFKAKDPKRKFPSEGSHTKTSQRSISNESSHANDPQRDLFETMYKNQKT